MRNPLTKRIPREIKNDLGKYIALFLFLIISIGFISGFLVAGDSMKSAFDNSFEKYNVEDGHFCLAAEIDDKTKENVENLGVKLYKNFYKIKTLTTAILSDYSKIVQILMRLLFLRVIFPKITAKLQLTDFMQKTMKLKSATKLKLPIRI